MGLVGTLQSDFPSDHHTPRDTACVNSLRFLLPLESQMNHSFHASLMFDCFLKIFLKFLPHFIFSNKNIVFPLLQFDSCLPPPPNSYSYMHLRSEIPHLKYSKSLNELTYWHSFYHNNFCPWITASFYFTWPRLFGPTSLASPKVSWTEPA